MEIDDLDFYLFAIRNVFDLVMKIAKKAHILRHTSDVNVIHFESAARHTLHFESVTFSW
jgi:hypothetical protein